MTGSCLIGWDLRKHAPGSWCWIPEQRPLLPGALAYSCQGQRQVVDPAAIPTPITTATATATATRPDIAPAIAAEHDNPRLPGSLLWREE